MINESLSCMQFMKQDNKQVLLALHQEELRDVSIECQKYNKVL